MMVVAVVGSRLVGAELSCYESTVYKHRGRYFVLDLKKCWDDEMNAILNDGEDLIYCAGGSVSENSLKNKYAHIHCLKGKERCGAC